jgi:tetratricopeptide (TPR) repeat protein
MPNSKSQIAIEYGYRIQQHSPNTWVFWVDAENITTMEEDYREIARISRIKGASDKDAEVFGLVSDWLRNEANGTWVMVLDNADDKEVFTSRPPKYRNSDRSKQIREFIPQSSNGTVLVTSRSRDVAFQITCNYKNIKTVEPMDETEALALLQNQLEDNHSDEDMELLVKTVDYIPIAITHAAAHISRRSLPIHSYLQELRDKDEIIESSLDENIPQLRRTAGRSSSVVTTWRVTFEYVRKTMPSAARLLSLMCLFDRQDIPKALLQGQYGEEVILSQSKTKTRKTWWKRRPRLRQKRQKISPPTANALPCEFEDDWLALRDFSLIKMNRDRKHFSMHPLVQFTTKKWLVQHQELDVWSQRFITILDATFPGSDNETFAEYEPLLAHAYAAIPYRPSNITMQPLRSWASLTRKVARYNCRRAALDTAQKMYRVAAEAFEITLGPAAPESLKCRTQQALMHKHMDQNTEAEAIYRHVLRLQQEIIGPEHLDTLDTMDSIGVTLAFQYRHAEAEVLHVRALEIRLRNLGPEHPSTQSSLNKRGLFLLSRKRYPEAYIVWKQAYKARNNGNDLTWVSELDLVGLKLQIDGRLTDAEHYLRESLTEKERMFVGKDDSTVIMGAAKLARVLLAQEKYIEAELLFRRALAWLEAVERKGASPYYPEWLQVMGELAITLSHTGMLGEAEELARQCLSTRQKSLGPKSRDVLATNWILASILEKQTQFEQAVELYKEAYEGAVELLGEYHEDTKDYQRDYDRVRAKLPDLVVDDPTKDLEGKKQDICGGEECCT